MTSNIRFISAGAGSGKTYALTEKLQELLGNAQVAPAGVIATTFTKLAAGELKEQVRSKLIAAGQLAVANQMEQSLIGTVNGVCGEILRRFAFEAGMPPDQQVLDESQGNVLFYQAMELALQDNKPLVRQMNATCHRLQITHRRTRQLLWRNEIKSIVDAARSNNQTGDDIRAQGGISADELLAHFPKVTKNKLNEKLLGAISHAIDGIDTESDTTKSTREYLSLITGIRAGLINRRATWPEWIGLSKKMPGTKSKPFAEPIADIAKQYDTHAQLHTDIRFLAEQVFEIAADSLDTYQTLKQQKGLLDFVDQEQRLYELLGNKNVAATLNEELQLLMVDEFQDTSPIQLALFLRLSTLADQVIWVGDIKQSIYGFRGSDPELIQAVIKRVEDEGNPPEFLEQSWRSRKELVRYTNALFTPAFANTLKPEQITLEPARKNESDEPAVEMWRLQGRRKELRALSLANAVTQLMTSGRTICDKHSGEMRDLTYADVVILCRTNDNLDKIATALSESKLPIRYNRAGLLSTPEGCLAMACLRRLIDPRDALASAEIYSLTTNENPEAWIEHRIKYLENQDNPNYQWLEDEENSPIANLKEQRGRLPYLTPVEALRVAINAGSVREAVYRWGPTIQRSQHRLNNLSALVEHAADYVDQCASRNEPATAAGLVLWLIALAEAEEDSQASGGDEAAIQLVTHHGAKGLEWPIVIAMDLEATLKPRVWGLSVLATSKKFSLQDPLQGRTLRYWPKFTGASSKDIAILDIIENSTAGVAAMDQEVEESKRLLYVSLTRARDGLIITMNGKKNSGPSMDTLDAEWMLPTADGLILPDESTVPSTYQEFDGRPDDMDVQAHEPQWLSSENEASEKYKLRISPSAAAPLEKAKIASISDLGERLEIEGEYDPAKLGSAIHAVIATKLMGQESTARILKEWGVQNTISIDSANHSADRFLAKVETLFAPNEYCPEYPIQYQTEDGQRINGWIDLLLKTKDGLILIDHKASPRARSDWEGIALGYSGQLSAYAKGLRILNESEEVRTFIHFAVTGGLVEVTV
jgi:ATP-dependent exoDNAse (exonuclease V) beta subunit